MLPIAVLAGGLGTRMAAVTGPDLPKALLRVAGRPFVDWKLEGLAAQGIRRVVLLLGHGAGPIAEHVGDGGRYGLDVAVVEDGPALLGTGGALRRALSHLGDAFWVTYGDTYLRAPMGEIEADFRSRRPGGLMTVLRNRDLWDHSNVRIEDGWVVEYRKDAPAGTYELIDYGMSIFTVGALLPFPAGEPFDLRAVIGRLIEDRALAAWEVTERFYEIGSPEGFLDTEAFLRSRPDPRATSFLAGSAKPPNSRTTRS